MYLLDTNPCIRYLNGRSEPLRRRIESAGEGQVAVCSVVKAELFFGAMKSRDPRQTIERQLEFLRQFASLPFDDRAAEIYGRIRADLERSGNPIGANDLLIASIAMANQVTLVTHNTEEFQRIAGLRIEDWELP